MAMTNQTQLIWSVGTAYILVQLGALAYDKWFRYGSFKPSHLVDGSGKGEKPTLKN